MYGTGAHYRVSLHVQFKYLIVFTPHVQYLPVWAKGLTKRKLLRYISCLLIPKNRGCPKSILLLSQRLNKLSIKYREKINFWNLRGRIT